MPTVIRFNKRQYLSSGVNLTELFDQIPEPIAYFDADDRLSACNLSFRNHFPIVIESEFLKRASAGPVSSQAGAGAPSRFLPPMANPSGESMPVSLPATITTARKSDFAPDIRKTPDGGTLLTLRDLSHQHRMEADYRKRMDALMGELETAHQAKQQAVELAQCRKDFLTTISHELRTPLNAILGFSEMIAKEMAGPVKNERYLEYAQIIHSSGVHVLSMVNDLLDLSKLDAGKLELQVEPVEILKIIIDCVRLVGAQATRDHIGISVHVFDGVDRLCGDNKRLRQMLLNLLSNALKFTPVGGEITIDVFRRGEGVAISVSDTGIGIRAEDIPKVLEPFGQVESEMSHKHPGTGLGLPLTKELAELHGGSLTMESSVDVGTTVTITLPPDPKSAAA
ncbi:MAG TPA: HAMP domain-containing sensor histidine kinase [Rhizomicrobium sp.]|jgi:two-component system cell cycle sensor histidine kinase PleC|nr:HAMP domain-containing sensor histidine kinase [Rhizomicrobium sp.]